MTKSTITRERLAKIKSWRETYGAGSNVMLPAEEAEELARMALAAMDSEPVAEVYQAPNVGICAALGPSIRMLCPLEPGTKLYRHPQPAPVVPEEATPDSIEILASARRRDHAVFQWDEDQRNAAADSWNAFRAAMLQELKKSAGTEAICRSDENVQVLHTKSPAQSDCFPEQNHASPEQNGDTPAQSQGWIQVSEQMPPSRHEVLVGRWWGERPRWCCKWATYIPGHPDAQSSGWLIPGGSWTPTHWMELPAAPQEVKGE